MPAFSSQVPRLLFFMCACLHLLGGQVVLAAPVSAEIWSQKSTIPLIEFDAPDNNVLDLKALGTPSGIAALNAISRGRWSSACSIATKVLASKIPDVDALGVFALCAAIHNDVISVGAALKRLREAEPTPYYSLLTEGVLMLRDGQSEKAETTFNTALKSNLDSPLTLYFKGEALYAQHKNVEALAVFKAVLKTWADHVPALTAVARILSAPNASRENLNEAIAMTERATTITPGSLNLWKLLAKLCDQAGQHDRANAITLQWLSSKPGIRSN